MKKIIAKIIAMVFIILFLFFQEIFAGGVLMDFKATDEKTDNFAKEFILEMEKKRNIVEQFGRDYVVRGYVGAWQGKKTGQVESAIGIFVEDEENPVIVILLKDLFSKKEIKKRAKEAVDSITKYLEKLEKRKSIKVVVKSGAKN